MIPHFLSRWLTKPTKPVATDVARLDAQLERDLLDRLARRREARTLPPIQRAAAIQRINQEAAAW